MASTAESPGAASVVHSLFPVHQRTQEHCGSSLLSLKMEDFPTEQGVEMSSRISPTLTHEQIAVYPSALVICCCVTNCPKTWYLKAICSYHLSQVLWVRNLRVASVGGLGSFIRSRRCWLGLQSLEGLTGTGRCDSKVAHSHGCRVTAGVDTWLQSQPSRSVFSCPFFELWKAVPWCVTFSKGWPCT